MAGSLAAMPSGGEPSSFGFPWLLRLFLKQGRREGKRQVTDPQHPVPPHFNFLPVDI